MVWATEVPVSGRGFLTPALGSVRRTESQTLTVSSRPTCPEELWAFRSTQAPGVETE